MTAARVLLSTRDLQILSQLCVGTISKLRRYDMRGGLQPHDGRRLEELESIRERLEEALLDPQKSLL